MPHNPRDVKLDQISEIDTRIRDGGVHYLISELGWDDATRFRDSLDAIGATGSHRCVAEFLQLARSENGTARDEITEFLSSNDNAINEYRDRYLSTREDLVALVSEFLSND